MVKDISGKISAGVGTGIEGIKRQVRKMAARVIKEQAPELNDEQVEQLTRAWIPQSPAEGEAIAGGKTACPATCLPP
jgi:C4-type Zn-finger protein